MFHFTKAVIRELFPLIKDYLTWMNKYSKHPEKYPIEKRYQKLHKLMKRLQKSSTETVTEQEFLIVYSNNVRESMLKLKKTGITDYLKFSIEQKSDLGALVNSTNTLIRRIDNR